MKCIFLIGLLLLVFSVSSKAQEFIPLWTGTAMPNSKGMKLTDSIANERVFRVGTPGMYAFFPSQSENKRAAVVICPGGGYERLAYVISGLQLAKWFNTIGISAFVLNYRLPNSPDLKDRSNGPLCDAQRALKFIRANAAQWNIDTNKIGIQGSSAGGHLAAFTSVAKADVSHVKDSVDHHSYLPNFMILVSPVIDMGAYAHGGSRKNLLGEKPDAASIKNYSPQLLVGDSTCPAFIVHAFDDKVVNPKNSLLFYEALLQHKVPSTLHIFPAGGHAIALRNNPGSTNLWTSLCEEWLKEMHFIQ